MNNHKDIFLFAAVALLFPLLMSQCASCSGADALNKQAILIDSLQTYIETAQNAPTHTIVIKDSIRKVVVKKYVTRMVKVFERDTVTNTVLDSFYMDVQLPITEASDTFQNENIRVISTTLSEGRQLTNTWTVDEKPRLPKIVRDTVFIIKPRCGFFRKIFKKCENGTDRK